MFKKRAKKVVSEGGAAQEREKFPGWKDADQEVKDWWIGLEELNRNDPETLKNAIERIIGQSESITDIWDAWERRESIPGIQFPSRSHELRKELESVLTLARNRRKRREEAASAQEHIAANEKVVREKLDGDKAGVHAREWWRRFEQVAFSDPASGLTNLWRVTGFLNELTDRHATLVEAYLAWVHTQGRPETLLAYLDEHRDELRREAARGGDDVRIPNHPYLWREDKLREGTAWYLTETAEGASPEATEWWRGVEEKHRGDPVALFLLVREVARQGASLDELHAVGTATEGGDVRTLLRNFEGRAAERRSLTSGGDPGTLRKVGPSKTQRTEIKTPEDQGLEALKAPAYLSETEKIALAAIGKLLDKHPRLATLVREKCDDICPPTEAPITQPAGPLNTERLIRTREAAKILGLSTVRVKQLAQRERIGALVGRRYLFSEQELHAFKQLDRPRGVTLTDTRRAGRSNARERN
jgi:excisionase family DNA binding protein